ncbi:MAG: type VI secretion system membrane subunit TssM [Dongiaceae bacterium]
MFKRILSVLTARWLVTLIGAIILALVVWFIGPLIAVGDVRPLESEIVRLIIVLVILVVWGIANIVSLLRAKKTNDQLVQGITQTSAADAQAADLEAAKKEEIGVLKERLEDAMALLKRAKIGKGSNRQYLYQLPWYILIGPPGSGKTTALVNSGLNFPLAEKFGKDAVRGVGGTRNCDWWFTDEAVLIDTAGRYTTQDSHQAVDAAAWTGFLKLLKSTRPRQPINGALVAIALSGENGLAAMNEAQRQAEARKIKQRIQELHNELGIRFPIYVLFTKVDLAAGFVEFMDDLGKEERQQVWGFTFPLDDGKSPEGPMADFDAEFELLQKRLYERLLERVHKESDIDRRSLIFGFPTQMASLKQVANEFLDQIFRPTRYEDRPLLRGVYFTSGTQEGTPIDRLMGVMASTFGLDRKRLSAFSGTGRSYFLTRLLRDVVFQEAGIVSRNRRVERMRVVFGWASVSLATVVILGMGALWYFSYLGNKQLVADFNTAIGAYKQQVADTGLQLNPVQDARLDLILPPLQTLRTMPAGYEQSKLGVPLSLRFGLYQGDKLGVEADAAYRRALNGLFLPRLLYRLESQLRANIDNPEFVYQALKVYLMLGVQGPLDKDLVKEWMAIDWNGVFPGAAMQPTRDQLAGHLDALLEQPLTEIGLDGNLVADARRTLEQYPVAQRAYAMIKQTGLVRDLPVWRVADHIGPQGTQVIARKTGDLADGVPGFYTYQGFHNAFVPAVENIAPEIARDGWIMGAQSQLTNDNATIARIASDVISIYVNDYVDQWTRLLGDITIVDITDKRHAAAVFNILAGPTSPLKNLLSDIARETKLTAPPPAAGDGGSGAAQQLEQAGQQQLQTTLGSTGRLGNLLGDLLRSDGSAGGAGGEAPPEQRVEERFKFLHDYVNGAPAPIDEAIQAINTVYLALNNALNQFVPSTGPDTALQAALQQLQAAAGRAPASVGEQLAVAAGKIEQLDKGEYRTDLNERFRSDVAQYCDKLVKNRYPIYADSGTDVTLDDFARLFAPGGVMDGFFKANLLPIVDTSRIPWRPQGDIPISSGALEQFRMAAAIRDALFASGTSPSARFEIVPLALDNAATQVLLELDGQVVTYSHGPQVPVQMQWPGTGPKQVRLSFQPQSPSSTIVKDGPWAFFRLIDEGQLSSMGPERFQITFNVGGHSASFEIRAGSVLNPFSLKELHRFRCPGKIG